MHIRAVCAVIREEDNQCVVQLSGLLKMSDEPSDMKIDVGNHGRIKLHPASR